MRDLMRPLIDSLESGRDCCSARWWRPEGRPPKRRGPRCFWLRAAARSAPSAAAASRTRSSRRRARIGRAGRGRVPQLRPRPRLRLGRRPDLRRQDGDPRRGPRGPGRWRTSGPIASCSRRAEDSPRPSSSIPSGRAARPSGDAVPVRPGRRRPCRLADGRGPPEAIATGSLRSTDGPGRRCKAAWPTCRRCRESGWSIVGAGHVGQAVAEPGRQADFDVWVVDDRHQYANPERFPTARKLIVGPIDEVLPNLEITPQTYALIVTRGHGHDQEALHNLAPTAGSYVGLIGSRRKIRLIFEALRDEGVTEQDLARVSAPVGLDIGSQTVAEIAISIVAELIARRNQGPPPSRASERPRIGPWPDRRPDGGFDRQSGEKHGRRPVLPCLALDARDDLDGDRAVLGGSGASQRRGDRDGGGPDVMAGEVGIGRRRRSDPPTKKPPPCWRGFLDSVVTIGP